MESIQNKEKMRNFIAGIIIFLVIFAVFVSVIWLICEDSEYNNYDTSEISYSYDNSNGANYMINQIYGEQIITYSAYEVSFNNTFKLPNYVKFDIYAGTTCNISYYTDPRVNTYPTNFLEGTEYKRGRLLSGLISENCPQTYCMINIVPMKMCTINSGWQRMNNIFKNSYLGYTAIIAPVLNYSSSIFNNELIYVPTGYIIVLMNSQDIICSYYLSASAEACGNQIDQTCNYPLPYFMS